MHNISQSNWNLTDYELKKRVKLIPDLVEKKGKQMNPNPLETSYQSPEAEALLKQALLEALNETLAVSTLTIRDKPEKFLNMF